MPDGEGRREMQPEHRSGYELQRWWQICFLRCKSEHDGYLCDHAHFITPLNNPVTNTGTGNV